MLIMSESHFLEVEVSCVEHLLCTRHTMFNKYPLNEWSLFNISQPTWKRESNDSYCTEEKTKAKRVGSSPRVMATQ